MDEAGEVDGTATVTCGEASNMCDGPNARLDLFAVLADGDIVRDEDLAVLLCGDNGFRFHGVIYLRNRGTRSRCEPTVAFEAMNCACKLPLLRRLLPRGLHLGRGSSRPHCDIQ